MRTIKNHAILFVIGLTISTGAFSFSGNIAAAEEPLQMRDYRLSLFQSGASAVPERKIFSQKQESPCIKKSDHQPMKGGDAEEEWRLRNDSPESREKHEKDGWKPVKDPDNTCFPPAGHGKKVSRHESLTDDGHFHLHKKHDRYVFRRKKYMPKHGRHHKDHEPQRHEETHD